MIESVATLVGFGHALRRAGVATGAERIRTFCEAAALAPADVYWAGRATLLWRPDQIPVYDEVFARYFGPPQDPGPEVAEEEDDGAAATPRVRPSGSGEQLETGSAEGSASPVELLHEKSFARCTEQEWAELAILLAELPRFLPRRRTRRYEPRRPGDLHVRRILRSAAATGGEPFKLRERRRRFRLRPLVFLLDVSGSMADYSRGLLLFAHAVLRSSADTEVYAFGTRLTRLTPGLAAASPELALRACESLVPDWDGGTRIGDALAAFLAAGGRQAGTRRSIAVICSDGLDTGDPAMLGEQAARLRRAVHRVVWLNPLKADVRYEPLARGMRSALPHVDVFESGHSVAALMSVVVRLETHHLASAHRMVYTPSIRSRLEES